MVERLLEGAATVSELAAPHDMSLPGAMKHVTKLEQAGLITRDKQGRTVTCALVPDPLDEASRWLTEHLDFWNARLDALDVYLKQTKKEDGS